MKHVKRHVLTRYIKSGERAIVERHHFKKGFVDGARKRPLATVSGVKCASMTLLDEMHIKSEYTQNVGRVYSQILTAH